MLTSNLIIFETANYSTSHSNALLLLVMSPTGAALNHRLQPGFYSLLSEPVRTISNRKL